MAVKDRSCPSRENVPDNNSEPMAPNKCDHKSLSEQDVDFVNGIRIILLFGSVFLEHKLHDHTEGQHNSMSTCSLGASGWGDAYIRGSAPASYMLVISRGHHLLMMAGYMLSMLLYMNGSSLPSIELNKYRNPNKKAAGAEPPSNAHAM